MVASLSQLDLSFGAYLFPPTSDNQPVFLFPSSSDLTPPEAPVYQAASPDEEALVSAARELGWVFLSRTRDSVVVSELGVTRQYQLLALLDFTSQRRRMSVLGQNRSPRPARMRKYQDLFFALMHSSIPAALQACLERPSSDASLFSLTVREPEGGLKLYCKGADLVIMERLQTGCANQERTQAALEV